MRLLGPPRAVGLSSQIEVAAERGESWNTAAILPATTREYSPEEDVSAVAIRCVDRLRNLSAPEMIVVD